MPTTSEVVFMFDTDALAQVFIAGQENLLKVLREDYGVRSFLMSEVEAELLSNKRISGLVRPRYEKALRSGCIKLLATRDLEAMFGESETKEEVTLQQIRVLAADLGLYVQTGEAHTHAAAILLSTPAVSNDMNAIRVLEANGKPLAPTVLRSFDLFGFLLMEDLIDGNAAEAIRKTLRSHNEWVPSCMTHASFKDGLGLMGCRLSTSLGAAGGTDDWSSPFYLKRSTPRP